MNDTQADVLASIVAEVVSELFRADMKHKDDPMTHMKVGLKTLECEFHELEREVDRYQFELGNPELLRKEAVQVAAMSLKFIRDICNPLR